MRDGVGEKTTSVARRFSALNHQATVQPGSRWGRNCLSERPALGGIRHMSTLHPLSHSSTQTQTITNTNSLPPISPPTFSAVHSGGTGGGIWGLFRWQFWPLWSKPRWAGFHLSCQFGHSELCCWCSTAAAKPDTDTSVKEQRWGDWSSSLKAGVCLSLSWVCFLSNICVITEPFHAFALGWSSH